MKKNRQLLLIILTFISCNILFSQGSACFTHSLILSTSLPTTSSFTKLISTDIDNDGSKDLIYSGGSVKTNQGNGNLNPKTNLFSGYQYNCLDYFGGDFNNDGIKDLICLVDSSGFKIVLALQTAGTGSYTVRSNTKIIGATISSYITEGDFNGDNITDVAVNIGNNKVQFLYGALGSFFGTTSTQTLTNIPLGRIVSDDVDNNNYDDLIIVDVFNKKFQILLNTASNFTSAITILSPTITPNSFCLSDINNDGLKDIVIGTYNSYRVCVFMSQGNGSYSSPSYYYVGHKCQEVISRDFDNDGFNDVLVRDEMLGTCTILRGNSGGVLNIDKSINSICPIAATSLLSDDFNNDGKYDLISLDSYRNLIVSKNLGNLNFSNFETANNFHASDNINQLEVADLNNDGLIDNAVKYQNIDTIFINIGDGTGKFTTVQKIIGPYVAKYKFADINNDNIKDIVINTTNISGFYTYLGNGNGTFGSSNFNATSAGSNYVECSDLNNDGNIDVITQTMSSKIGIFYGTGSGTFNAPVEYSIPTVGTNLTTGDYNGDGYKDLVTSIYSNNYFLILWGNASNTFTTTSTVAATGPSILMSADLNGDGKTDFVGNTGSGLNIYYASGTNSFTPYTNINTIAKSLDLKDIDNDGRADIIFAADFNYFGTAMYKVSAILNSPVTPFTKFIDIESPFVVYAAKAADVDGDNMVDILTGSTPSLVFHRNSAANILAVSSPTFCTGGQVVLKAVSEGLGYIWQPGSLTGDSIFASSTGVYTLSLANAILGCANNSSTFSVNAYPNLVLNAVSTTSNSCIGTSFNLYASGANTYSWSTGANTNTVIVAPVSTTIYSVNATDNHNCVGSATTQVIVNQTPTITVNSGAICSGQSFTLTPNGANAYTFSGNSAFVSPTATTNYTVTGTDVNGCSNTAVSSVSVNPLPTFTISGPTNTITCLNPSTSFTVNTAHSILWTGPGTINPAPMVATPFVNTIGIYTVTVTDANLCSNTGTVEVVANVTVPIVNLNVMTPVFCEGGSTSIVANSTPSNNVSYLWDNGATTQSISVSPTVTTMYTVTVTDNTNGCYVSDSTDVIVFPIPSLTLTASTSTVCIGTSTVIGATSNAVSYYWSNGANTLSTTITPTVTTTYTFIGTNQYGCISSETVSVIVDNTCTDVWPGDANSDGTADNLDILELGLHYTQTGTPRASASNNWQSYFANNWSGTITNGKNLNHSDCNGDGIINDNDTLAIYNNYGLTHAFKSVQTNTVNPQLSIVPDQAMVVKGMWGTASIYLGDATTNIANVNGVAFTVDFDNTLIEASNVWIEYQNSFIDVSQNLYFRKLDFANSKLFTASTHTISNNVSGFGKIATLHYQILSSLSTDQVLNIGLSQANQSDAAGTITPLTSGTGTLMAIGASVDVKENLLNGHVLISPNPTNGILNISFNRIPQNTKVELYNSIGALVLTEAITNKNSTIHVSDLSSGIYFMKVLEGNKVIAVKKVVRE